MMKVYLMPVDGPELTGHRKELLAGLDEVRREKVLKCQVQEDRDRSLGAGLLLQYALQEWTGVLEQTSIGLPTSGPGTNRKLENGKKEAGLFYYTTEPAAVTDRIKSPLKLSYQYGKKGKPYLAKGPYFSLSHSGRYAACAVSDQEIGLDIQQCKRTAWEKTARRFYTSGEQACLECLENEQEKERLFYRLWTRKEAYGKLTGEGLTAGLMLSMENTAQLHRIQFYDCEIPPDYQVCVCFYCHKPESF